MKKIIITIIIIAFAIGLKAQKTERDTVLYKVEYNKKIQYIFHIDTTTVIFKSKKKYSDNLIEYANNIIIDTLTFYFIEYMPDFKNNRLYWLVSNNKKNDFYYFNLNTFKFNQQQSLKSRAYKGLINGNLFAPQVIKEPENKKNEIDAQEYASGGIKEEWELERKIFSYDTINGTENEIINVDKYTISEYEDIEEFTISPTVNKILLHIGTYESGSYSGRRYLVYDIGTKKGSIKNYKGNKYIECDNCEFFLCNMFYDYGGYFYMNNYKYSTGTNNMLVLDSNFNIRDTLLSRQLENKGFIFKNKEVKGFYFNSYIYKNDRRKDVIIPSIMNYGFEKLLSNIYYDIKLIKKDVTKYDINELSLLKNMIFAKHNYEFESDYYQAYFNLYRFYNSEEKRKTRTKNVNHLSTKVDKENLKLIKKAIKSVE